MNKVISTYNSYNINNSNNIMDNKSKFNGNINMMLDKLERDDIDLPDTFEVQEYKFNEFFGNNKFIVSNEYNKLAKNDKSERNVYTHVDNYDLIYRS